MTPAEISAAKGAEVFPFDLAHFDIAQSFVFDKNDWGPFRADNVDVVDAVRQREDDAGVAVEGSWTASVTLFHLDEFVGAIVLAEPEQALLEFSLDGGTTWENSLAYIDLSGDPDFDVRATFFEGVPEFPDEPVGELTRLTVHVFKSLTMRSEKNRNLTYMPEVEGDGIRMYTIHSDPTDSPYPVGSVETIVTIGGSGTLFDMEPARVSVDVSNHLSVTSATVYVDGVLYNPATAYTGSHHIVIVPSGAPSNGEFLLGADAAGANTLTAVFTHIAIHDHALTATEAANLYAAQNPTPVRIDDSGTITVTEHSPATEIYAYAWSVVTR